MTCEHGHKEAHYLPLKGHPDVTDYCPGCQCDACLEDVEIPPTDHVSDQDRKLDMAWDACWQDGQE